MSAIFLTIKKGLPRGAKRSGGMTLVETILYIVLLTFLMGVIVQMLIAMGGVYRNIKLTRELESSGTIVMESMLREIRNADSVVTNESTFDTSPGVLTVAGIDKDLNPYKFAFNVASGVIQVSKNGGAPTALTSSSGAVSYLLFTHVATGTSEGVRIELQMSGTSGSASKNERFYGFAVLRGSY